MVTNYYILSQTFIILTKIKLTFHVKIGVLQCRKLSKHVLLTSKRSVVTLTNTATILYLTKYKLIRINIVWGSNKLFLSQQDSWLKRAPRSRTSFYLTRETFSFPVGGQQRQTLANHIRPNLTLHYSCTNSVLFEILPAADAPQINFAFGPKSCILFPRFNSMCIQCKSPNPDRSSQGCRTLYATVLSLQLIVIFVYVYRTWEWTVESETTLRPLRQYDVK